MDGNVNSFKELMEVISKFNSEEEIADFVMKRLKLLEDNSTKRTISKNNNGCLIGTINSGYINSKSPIITSFMVDPFYMDDATLYIEFLKYIKNKNYTSILQIFYDLRDFMEEAFGFKGTQALREFVYLQEKENISIADFYKNNSALCSERSAAVHNLAEFCCINSYLVFGKMNLNGHEEEHAYNIFCAKDGTLILFDPTNPVAVWVDDKIGYLPAFTIIGKKEIEDIEMIEFDFDYLLKLHNYLIHESEVARQYKTCNFEIKQEAGSNKKI